MSTTVALLVCASLVVSDIKNKAMINVREANKLHFKAKTRPPASVKVQNLMRVSCSLHIELDI